MAQPYVTGPAGIFCSLAGTPTFLGHCERSPSIQIRPYYSPVFNDFSGQRVPLDMAFDGMEAMVSLDLTRYNETVYTALSNLPDGPALGTGTGRGTTNPGDMGSLMIQEGLTFQMWITFPYAAKAAMSSGVSTLSGGPMPACYHFWAAYLEGPDDLGPLGTTARRLRLNFHCIRAITITTSNPLGAGTFLLYDNNAAAVSGLLAA